MTGPLKGKDRAALRSEAHHLDPVVHVGHAGATDTVIAALDDALRTRELVKIDISKHLDLSPKEMARVLAEATGSDVVQVIGRKVTVYRENPELH